MSTVAHGLARVHSAESTRRPDPVASAALADAAADGLALEDGADTVEYR